MLSYLAVAAVFYLLGNVWPLPKSRDADIASVLEEHRKRSSEN